MRSKATFIVQSRFALAGDTGARRLEHGGGMNQVREAALMIRQCRKIYGLRQIHSGAEWDLDGLQRRVHLAWMHLCGQSCSEPPCCQSDGLSGDDAGPLTWACVFVGMTCEHHLYDALNAGGSFVRNERVET